MTGPTPSIRATPTEPPARRRRARRRTTPGRGARRASRPAAAASGRPWPAPSRTPPGPPTGTGSPGRVIGVVVGRVHIRPASPVVLVRSSGLGRPARTSTPGPRPSGASALGVPGQQRQRAGRVGQDPQRLRPPRTDRVGVALAATGSARPGHTSPRRTPHPRPAPARPPSSTRTRHTARSPRTAPTPPRSAAPPRPRGRPRRSSPPAASGTAPTATTPDRARSARPPTAPAPATAPPPGSAPPPAAPATPAPAPDVTAAQCRRQPVPHIQRVRDQRARRLRTPPGQTPQLRRRELRHQRRPVPAITPAPAPCPATPAPTPEPVELSVCSSCRSAQCAANTNSAASASTNRAWFATRASAAACPSVSSIHPSSMTTTLRETADTSRGPKPVVHKGRSRRRSAGREGAREERKEVVPVPLGGSLVVRRRCRPS